MGAPLRRPRAAPLRHGPTAVRRRGRGRGPAHAPARRGGVTPALAAATIRGDERAIRAGRGAGRIALGFAARFVDACLRYDEGVADQVLSEVLAVYPAEDACSDVLVPSLERIGELWQRGDLPVAAEHLASGPVRNQVATLNGAYLPLPGARLVVLACAPGELHEIGSLMLGLFLRRRGWRVLSLGQNTPPEELAHVADVLGPAATVVSATRRPTARRALEECARLAPRLKVGGAIVAFGGQGS